MADFDLSYIVKAVDDFTPVFEKLKQALKQQEQAILTFQQKAKNLSATFKGIGSTLRNYVTLPIMVAAGYAFKTYANFEEMQLRLKGMTKSAVEYEQVWNNIKSLSMKMPFSQEQLTAASTQLLSAGVAVKDIKGRLIEYGMVAKVSNKTLEEMTDSFTKAEKRGGMMARMLSNMKGVPIVPMIHQMYLEIHKTDKGWEQWLKKGVAFSTIKQALDRMTASGTEFAKAAEKMFVTPSSMMELAHNALRIYTDDLMEALLNTNDNTESLKKMRDIVADFEPKFRAWAEAHKNLLKIGAYALVAAASLAILAGIAALLMLAISPITLIGIALIAVGYAAYKLYTDFKPQLKQIAQFFVEFLLNPIQAVEDRFKSLIQHVKNFFGLFTHQPAINIQPNVITPQLGAIGGLNVGTAGANVGIDMRVHDRTNVISGITSTSKSLSKFNVDYGSSTAFAGGW